MLIIFTQRTVARYLLLAIIAVLAAVVLIRVYAGSEPFYRFLVRLHSDVPTLSIGLDDCWELEAVASSKQLRCWLDPLQAPKLQRVRIIVRSKIAADLSVDCEGCKDVACHEHFITPPASLSAGHCRDILIRASSSPAYARLRQTDSGRLLGERIVEFAVLPRSVVEELRLRWQAAVGNAASMESLVQHVQSLLASQVQGDEQDRTQILLALLVHDMRLQFEGMHGPPNLQRERHTTCLLEDALLVARRRRWLRSEAELSQHVASHYLSLESKRDSVDALENLLEGRDWLQLLPVQKLYCYRMLIRAALERQDLRRMAHKLGEVLDDIQLLNNPALLSTVRDIQIDGLEIVLLTGSWAEIADGLKKLEAAAVQADGNPCEQAKLWAGIGWLRLQLLELGCPECKDPLPALEKARALREHRCLGPSSKLANIWANLARAHSAAWWRRDELSSAERSAAVQATRFALTQMRKTLGAQEESDEGRFDRLLSEVRIHLLEGAQGNGVALMDELSKLTPQKESLVDGWLVLVYNAELMEASGRTRAAIDAFRQADRQIATLLHLVPSYQSHRLVTSRFAYSSQRAIELSLRIGRTREALEILRQFNQSALGLTATPWWPEQSPDTGISKARRPVQIRFQAQRLDYERRIELAPEYRVEQCQELARVKTQWLDSFDILLTKPSHALFAPPSIPDGDLLLGCTQQRQRWVCLSSLYGKLRVIDIASPALTEQSVEQYVLPALFADLHRATRLRILAHGRLAQLDLASIHFNGTPLGHQKPIIHTVDRPPTLAPLSIPRESLLVLEPDNDLPGFSPVAAAELLTASLGKMHVVPYGTDTTDDPHDGGTALHEAVGSAILDGLPRSDVFVYFGHIGSQPCPRGTVCCTDPQAGLRPDDRFTSLHLRHQTSLTTADVLAAVRVPQRAFLLGCASADRSTSTPTELLGMAQAFALRGSHVLAFARRIPAQDAAEVLCALGQHQLSDPNFDFGTLVMDIQRRLAHGERCMAQGKWYSPACMNAPGGCPTIDWQAVRWYGP